MALLTNASTAFAIGDVVDFSYINRGPKKLPIHWTQTNDPSSLLAHAADYVVGRNGSDMWTVVPSEYIWSQWSWFKRLVLSGLEESQSRVVRLGDWVDQSMIELLISCLCSGEGRTIELTSAITLLEHAKELDFVDDAGNPTASFAHRLTNCALTSCITPTTVRSRVGHLKAYDLFGFTSKVEDLIDHLLRKDQPSDLTQVFEELSADLLIKIKNHALAKKTGSKK